MLRGVRRRGENGVATVWAIWSTVVVIALGWVGLVLGVAVARQHHLDGAADLVAVSAAADLAHGGSACSTADQIADANAVTLRSCAVQGSDVAISVTDLLQLPLGLDEHLVSYARAGPD